MKFWDTGEEVVKKEGFDFDKEKQALIDNLDYLFAIISTRTNTIQKVVRVEC